MEEKRENSKPAIMHIDSLIHVIRGKHVMLDSDLARLYGVETKYLKRAVRSNITRFPIDFMMEITLEELGNLRCNFCTSSKQANHGGTRYKPYVFTEQGVAMLSSVLKSETAIEINIQIMRAFTAMRSFMQTNSHMLQRLETIEHHQLLLHQHQNETDRKIEEVMTRLDNTREEPIEGFFFDGQIFDAYSLISDLVRKAKTRIILIDNYVDDKILKILDKRDDSVRATIYTDPKHSHIDNDLQKHNAQYPAIELKKCTNVHDRFLIIDDSIYFIGGSIKDLGKKIVAFSQMCLNPNDIISKLK